MSDRQPRQHLQLPDFYADNSIFVALATEVSIDVPNDAKIGQPDTESVANACENTGHHQ